jgi:hypothetical protein
MPANLRKTKANFANASLESGSSASSAAMEARIDAVNWAEVHADLDAQGWGLRARLEPRCRVGVIGR